MTVLGDGPLKAWVAVARHDGTFVNEIIDDYAITLGEELVLRSGPLPSSPNGMEWRVVQAPAGSNASMAMGDLDQGRFVFNGDRAGPDLVGTYFVGPRVHSGTWGWTPETTVPVEVVAPGLYVEATWSDGAADLDLHLVKDQAGYCQGNDVNFKAPSLDWDGVAGESDGDGFLSVASVPGSQAEVAQVIAPVPGTYRVAVEHYAGSATTLTLRVLNGTELIDTRSFSFSGGLESFEALDIVVTDETITTTPIETSQAGLLCGGT